MDNYLYNLLAKLGFLEHNLLVKPGFHERFYRYFLYFRIIVHNYVD